jgi:hypothetical protein
MLLKGVVGGLQVRLAVPDDVVALHGLMGNISNGMQLQEAFLHAVGEGKSYAMLWISSAYCTGCVPHTIT